MADGPSSSSSPQVTASEPSASGLSDATRCSPFVPGPDGEEEPDELPDVGTIECSICLQSCVHPVRLPCSHIFCFLCVKGVANHSKRCALCRSDIPPDFLLRPILLNTEDVLHPTQAFDGKYQWFYEGVRGWWQYDVRASTEIEERFQKGERLFEMLIAGFLYIVDMENMVQYRRNTPARRRRIKRDLVDIPDKKGIAGLSCKQRPPRRTGGDGGEREDALAAAAAAARSSSGGSAGQGLAPPAARNNNNNGAQVTSVQQQMRDLTLTDGDDGAADHANPRRNRGARATASRSTTADGVDEDAQVNSRAADASPVRQLRSSRVNRQPHDGPVNGQPNQGTRVNRVNPESVNGSSSLGSRMNRRDIDGHDATLGNGQPSTSARIGARVSSTDSVATANAQPSTSGRVNSRVSAAGSDGQPPSLNSRGNRVNSSVIDLPANRQPRQRTRGVSQRVEISTNNGQPVSNDGVNQVAGQAMQPVVSVVQNSVDVTPTRNELATLDQVGQASLPDVLRASAAERKIEGKAETDRTDHVDGSSDSD